MRSLTSNQTQALQSENRSEHVRVRIDRGSNDFVDLSDFEGRDWIASVDLEITFDVGTQMATVALYRTSYDLNLAPFVDGSKLNQSGAIADIGNPIKIETAVLAMDQKPLAADWVEIFDGEIDEIDWAGDFISLRCRDKSGGIIDTFIQTQRLYPKQSGAADDQMEYVIQDIIDDNSPAITQIQATYTWNGTTTITTGDTSEVSVGDYIGILSGNNKSAYFKIDSIVVNTSITILNPQSRTIPTTTDAAFKIPAANRVTLYSANGTTATPFNAADSPGFRINTYKQKKGSLFTQVRRIAVLIGYCLEYRYQTDAAAFELQLLSPDREVAAQGTWTLTGTMTDGDTLTIDTHTLTAKNTPVGNNQFQIGASAAATAANIVTTFNGTSTAAAVSFALVDPTDSTKVIATWGTLGTAGNSITFSESSTDVTADGGGLLGGTRAGSDGKTTADFTFDDDDYYKINNLTLSRRDIRNKIHGNFVDPTDSSRVTTVIRKDTASITKYGERYMEITEGPASQIDTVSEMINFCDAALADLKDPDATQGVEQRLFWPAEPGDLYKYLANDQHYDTDQQFAVSAIRHSFREGGNRTLITTRGKPAGGLSRWLELQGIEGLNPALDEFADDQAANVATSPGIGLVVVTYDDPRTMTPPIEDWLTTECHISTTSGFTPTTSTLVAVGKQTRFEIGGLVPGTTYYVKLIILDTAGNRSTVSTQVSVATEKVGPYHENEDRQHDVLLLNEEFGAQTLDETTNMPDYWSVTFGTYGSGGNVYFVTDDSQTGNRAIDFRNDTTPSTIESDLFPLTAGSYYILEAVMKTKVDPADLGALVIDVDFYDKDKVDIGGASQLSVDASSLTLDTWTKVLGVVAFQPTASTRYGSVLAFKNVDTAAFRMLLDSVRLKRTLIHFSADRVGTQTGVVTGTWTKFLATSTVIDNGLRFNTTSNRFECDLDGLYAFTFNGHFTDLNSGNNFRCRVTKNGSTVLATSNNFVSVASSAFDNFSLPTGAVLLSSGDFVEAEVRHEKGSNATIGNDTLFYGSQLTL